MSNRLQMVAMASRLRAAVSRIHIPTDYHKKDTLEGIKMIEDVADILDGPRRTRL
jgi:hypothetical protein